jgi:hypothetical protein
LAHRRADVSWGFLERLESILPPPPPPPLGPEPPPEPGPSLALAKVSRLAVSPIVVVIGITVIHVTITTIIIIIIVIHIILLLLIIITIITTPIINDHNSSCSNSTNIILTTFTGLQLHPTGVRARAAKLAVSRAPPAKKAASQSVFPYRSHCVDADSPRPTPAPQRREPLVCLSVHGAIDDTLTVYCSPAFESLFMTASRFHEVLMHEHEVMGMMCVPTCLRMPCPLTRSHRLILCSRSCSVL